MKLPSIYFFITVLLCIPILLPLLQPGLPKTDDGLWAVVRLAEMNRELRGFQFPPRWSSYLNHGYGYPLFLFTYPLPYLVGEFFHLLGLGLVATIKLLFSLSVIGSVVTMYLVIKELWGKQAALVSAILYAYFPYRITNLYIRGNLGESLATIFYPLLFYFSYKVISTKKIRFILWHGISLAGLILTHNASVVLFLLPLAVWTGWLLKEQKLEKSVIIRTVISFGSGLFLSSFFWLSALFEKKYIALSKIPLTNISDHFVHFSIFITNIISKNLPQIAFSFAQFGVIVLALQYVVSKKEKNTDQGRIRILLLLVGFILFTLTPYSRFFWQLPLFKEIDFPWRMLSILGFLTSFIVGWVAKTGKSTWMMALLIIFGIVGGAMFIHVKERIYQTDAYYASNDATTTSADELMPIWVVDKPKNRPDHSAFSLSQAHIEVTSFTDTKQTYSVSIPSETRVIFNTVYFPGWNIFVDAIPAKIATEDNSGLMTTLMSAGNHMVELRFTKTSIRTIADIVSLVSIFSWICLWIYSKKQRLY